MENAHLGWGDEGCYFFFALKYKNSVFQKIFIGVVSLPLSVIVMLITECLDFLRFFAASQVREGRFY